MLDPESALWSPDGLAAHLDAASIETRPLWKPMHLQPVFAGTSATLDGSAQWLFERGLMLPSGSAMSDEQFARVSAVISAATVR